MFKRRLDLRNPLRDKSVLLLGPRMTGKSTLVRATFPDAFVLDLLDPATFRELAFAPERIAELVRAEKTRRGKAFVTVVDEVQKLPALFDPIHRMIETDKRQRFLLTGSSARKLRRGHTNLMAGRARPLELFPITTAELVQSGGSLDHRTLMVRGGLPSVLDAASHRDELLDYVGLYLKEEIQAEALARSITGFARFLETAAVTNGEQVNFTAVASDAQVPARTVREYYQVLEDTLVGALLPAFRKTKTRKAMATAKFFFFDVGVANALLGRFAPRPGTPEWGRAFEHLVFCELRAANAYQRAGARLSYWRSLSQLEVDFVVEREGGGLLAVEAKAKAHVADGDLGGLRALAEERLPLRRRIVVCEERQARRTGDGIDVLPAARFFEELWSGALL